MALSTNSMPMASVITFTIKVGGVAKSVTTPLPSAGTWHFISATYDRASFKLYVDGVMKASTSATGAIATTTSALLVGAKSTTDTVTGDYFKGQIDDVRLYGGRALTLEEILAVMNVR